MDGLKGEFAPVLERFQRERHWLLPALQAVQHAVGYLPSAALFAELGGGMIVVSGNVGSALMFGILLGGEGASTDTPTWPVPLVLPPERLRSCAVS